MSSVRRENQPQKPGLADYAALYIRCDDCGNEKRMAPHTLVSFAERGIRCADTLRPKLVCQPCREAGRYGRNLDLVPTFRRE